MTDTPIRKPMRDKDAPIVYAIENTVREAMLYAGLGSIKCSEIKKKSSHAPSAVMAMLAIMAEMFFIFLRT